MGKDRIALILAKMKGGDHGKEEEGDSYDKEDESGLSAAGDELKSALEDGDGKKIADAICSIIDIHTSAERKEEEDEEGE